MPSLAHAFDRQSLLTAVLTWAAFAWVFSPQTSTLLLVVLFVHELGHLMAIRWLTGQNAKIRFVPFMGGYTQFSGALSPWQQCIFTLGGPISGTVFAALCLFGYLSGGSNYLLVLAYIGVLINGLNLIPLPPLDGGQLMRWLGKGWWGLGVILAIALVLWQRSTWTLVIVGWLLWSAWQYFQATQEKRCSRCGHPHGATEHHCSRCASPVRLLRPQQVMLWGLYLGTIAALVAMALYMGMFS